MNANARRSSTALGLVVLMSAALAAPVPSRAAGAPLGAESPEKLVERMRHSAEKKDFRELAACLAPEPRKELAQMIWMGATMMIGMATTMGTMGSQMAEGMADAMGGEAKEGEAKAEKAPEAPKVDPKLEALAKRYDEVAHKHGLPGLKDEKEPAGDPAKLFDKVDAVEVVGDFGALLDGIGEATGEAAPAPPVPAGKLEGLKIDGDHATAKLDDEPITFVKIDGRWFIAELPKKPGAAE
ncbi:MAG TPA: hypothetical protein VGS22_21325 [Thermoanaerobaculia bacterium]|jgi:hypothetical protein|nr:hypothetical protein [Thermoanaerobaculia bacterium]